WRGALPQVVVEAGRRRAFLAFADRAAVGDVPRLREVGPADDPLAHLVDGLDDPVPAAALVAHLHLLLVLAGGLDHQLALARVVRAGLLDVDVFPGRTGQDGGRGVPVVAGRDHQG